MELRCSALSTLPVWERLASRPRMKATEAFALGHADARDILRPGRHGYVRYPGFSSS